MKMASAFRRAADRSCLSSSSFVISASSDKLFRELRAQHTRSNLGEGGVAARRGVVKERRESAVVGSTEVLDWDVLRRFKHTVAHFFGGLDVGVDRSGDSHENPLIRFAVFANDFQSMATVRLAREGDVEIPRLELEQARQQLCVVDIRAVCRIEVVPRAGMDSDAPALFRREPREREVVQVDEAVQEIPGWIDLYG